MDGGVVVVVVVDVDVDVVVVVASQDALAVVGRRGPSPRSSDLLLPLPTPPTKPDGEEGPTAANDAAAMAGRRILRPSMDEIDDAIIF